MRSNKIEDENAELELLFLTNGTMALLRKYYLGEVNLSLEQIRDFLKKKLRWLFDSFVREAAICQIPHNLS